MKFKLLFHYCYLKMSQLHFKEFFLLDFVHNLSSTTSLSLLELSSASKSFEISRVQSANLDCL